MTVPTTPQITSPAEGAVVSGVITVEWTASTLPDVVAPEFIASAAVVYEPEVVAGAAPNTIAAEFIASESEVFAPEVAEGSSVSPFVEDTFSGETDGTLLQNHVGEVGATWTQRTGGDATIVGDQLRPPNVLALYYASGVPATADYDVSVDFVYNEGGNISSGPAARMSTSSEDGYVARYGDEVWQLFRQSGGSYTNLGEWADAAFTSGSKKCTLRVRGDQISLLIDGVVRIGPVTDATYPAAGRAGFWLWAQSPTQDAYRLDNFEAVDA